MKLGRAHCRHRTDPAVGMYWNETPGTAIGSLSAALLMVTMIFLKAWLGSAAQPSGPKS